MGEAEGKVSVLYMRRRQLGLTQLELAILSGVPQGTISRLEAGKRSRPGAHLLGLLAGVLGCSIEQLLMKAGNPHD